MNSKFNKPEDYAHNTRLIRIRCYFCLLEGKTKNQTHAFKNLAGLAWHVKRNHKGIQPDLESEFIEILENISKALFWDML